MTHSSSYLYEETLERIRSKIRRGEYLPGDRLPSIADIAAQFNVGRNTALRVIDELNLQGLATKRRGKGTFLRDVIKPASFAIRGNAPKQIRRVIFFSDPPNKARGTFSDQFHDGALERALALDLDFRAVHESAIPEQNQSLRLPFHIKAGEGLIAKYIRDINLVLRETLIRRRFPCVLIDNVFPNVGSVLTDNNYGMTLLVGHLYEMGHRHVAFAGRFSPANCAFNATERMEAFVRETEKRGMRGDVLTATAFSDLIKILRVKPRPSALLFPMDISATNAARFFGSHGIRIPDDISVCGFDDYIAGGTRFSDLTTVRIDTKGLGRAAVDLVIEMAKSGDSLMFWKRVKPKLIIRKSVKRLAPALNG